MKRIASVLVLIIALSVSARAQYAGLDGPGYSSVNMNLRKERHPVLHNGTFIRLGLFLPAEKYYYPIDLTDSAVKHEGKKYANTGINLQVGSSFYFGPPIANKLRLGLDVSWFDVSFATMNGTRYGSDDYTLDIKLAGFGPLVSFSPISVLAIDTYVKVMPAVNLLLYGNGDVDALTGYNLNYLFGLGFRFAKLNAGLEINWGDMKMLEHQPGDAGKWYINNTRLYLGVRF